MRIVCLDLEGVLVPEIWIALAEAAGIPELRRTTRDEPDYGKLMRFRLELLEKHGLKLADIQGLTVSMEPLEGAAEFVSALTALAPLIILSDTFQEFARPLIAKLGNPVLFCNSLVTGPDGRLRDFRLRQQDGKKKAVAALQSLNMQIFAAGDSFNDLAMIRAADDGCLFRAPPKICEENRTIPCINTYGELLGRIQNFLAGE